MYIINKNTEKSGNVYRSAAIANIGCKVNKYEADAIAESLSAGGYNIVDFNRPADVYIVNTCTVTNTGDKKSRQLIRRAKLVNKDSILIVCGCYAQISPKEVLDIEGVDIVLGVSGHAEITAIIDRYISDKVKRSYVEHDFGGKSSGISKPGRVRAYVKIQDGCDNYCSYCIIPYARGSARSRGYGDIIDEAARLRLNGAKEIVLTGIHLASYGKDLGNITLLDVIKGVNGIDGLKRLRLGSLEPNLVTDEFLTALGMTDKICDYFHLSLQSGSDETLKRMNRKYTKGMYKNAVDRIHAAFPQGAVWTDVIAGFPGETAGDFEESYEFIKSSGVVRLHVFPFSAKEGTAACKMSGKVPNNHKLARVKMLRELSDNLYDSFLEENLGNDAAVLFEKRGKDGYYYGHTKNNILAKAKSAYDISNMILETRLVKKSGGMDIICEIK